MMADKKPSLTTKPAITPGVESYINQIVTKWKIPGLSIGVIHPDSNDKVEFKCFGRKNEAGDPVTSEVNISSILQFHFLMCCIIKTLFNIGSCSKSFLTAAM